MQAQQFLQSIVETLVEYPRDIHIEQKEDELGTLVTLRVHQSDMKTIIGRSGQTVMALRTILRVFGSTQNLRVNLKVEDRESIR